MSLTCKNLILSIDSMAQTNNHHLPEELLEKIFLPQPFKSLVQWTCVCKSWHQVLSSKSFFKAYVAHQKTSSNTSLLHNYADPVPGLAGNKTYNVFFEFLSYYGRGRRLLPSDSYYSALSDNGKRCTDSQHYCLERYGDCDGLLCLSAHQQLKFLVSHGCIEPLCDLLNCRDTRILTVALEGLENILKIGKAEKNLGHTGDVNVYALLISEAGGTKKIKNLDSLLSKKKTLTVVTKKSLKSLGNFTKHIG